MKCTGACLQTLYIFRCTHMTHTHLGPTQAEAHTEKWTVLPCEHRPVLTHSDACSHPFHTLPHDPTQKYRLLHIDAYSYIMYKMYT